MTNYGTTQFNGETITLTQYPQVDNYGADGGVAYYGKGINEAGKPVNIMWHTTAAWDARAAAGEDIAGREDEACDWDNADRVTLA